MNANGNGSVKKWDESDGRQISSEMKITKASIEFNFTGDIEGVASEESVMFYDKFDANERHNSTAVYSGFIHFEGKIAGKSGSFVMEDGGVFESGEAESRLTILKGSGTGELKNIFGEGSYTADKSGFSIELDFTL
jgi:hypothetical protein